MVRMIFRSALFLYGFNYYICMGAKVWPHKYSRSRGSVKLDKEEHEKNYELNNIGRGQTFYNPVLQNVSTMFDFLNTVEQSKNNRRSTISRKERSTNRNCSGLCEFSLCTWTEKWHEERSRVPRFIKYAVCDSPLCNFDFAGLDNAAMSILQINTHCDIVNTDLQVTKHGRKKWLMDWPIACVCTQRVVDIYMKARHPGSSLEQIDVDITNNGSISPVSRQRVVLGDERQRSLTASQLRRLRKQTRRMKNAETWEQIMTRKHNRS